jgi:putative FmdB family regulatory protein
MPIYCFKCPQCLIRYELFRRMAEMDLPAPCGSCGSNGARQLSAVRIAPDFDRYQCPITGKSIEGRAAHRENLARHGCRILEPGETQDAINARKRSESEFDSSIDRTVDDFIGSLPESSRSELFKQASSHEAVITRI